ncbi:cytoskeletal protein CcmA (bactofilin family) [Lutibacter oceani]|uniref:Cytoskeletal protein CcmA (Bactofilin family) n=1 Tax=Lutibacter oceani TaxID=1853311 RepID=A0A3D9RUP8_9FLAO|nr:polymer-forming cytoskeletal protein [Lutibacter oceani]REE83700.1 cytoskeletal protein CcmA (bactofilin family) [Lutibacter oceani]
MFSEKKEKQPQTLERNIIGKNTSIVGDIISEGDFRIDGKVEGTIKTNGRVIIGGSGFVSGKVECNYADIEGKFSGELSVNNILSLKATAKISGNVIIGKLSVEPGAEFNATCAMKNATVKELKNEQNTKERTA